MPSLFAYLVDVSEPLRFMQAIAERYQEGGVLAMEGPGLPASWPGLDGVAQRGDEFPAAPVVGIPLTAKNVAILVRDVFPGIPWREGVSIVQLQWADEVLVYTEAGFAPGVVALADVDDVFLASLVDLGIVSDYRLAPRPVFGDHLFSDSRFIRWTLIPVLLLFAVSMPFLIPEWTAGRVILTVATSLVSLLLALGLFSPERFRWAFRGVTALVFLGYAAFMIDEFFFSGHPILFPVQPGEPNPIRSLLGFIVIGMPCLWYTLLGRFRLRR
jgi:hypothetical protein